MPPKAVGYPTLNLPGKIFFKTIKSSTLTLGIIYNFYHWRDQRVSQLARNKYDNLIIILN